MNTLVEHLIDVCKRNRTKTDPANITYFLEELDDKTIIELLHSKKEVVFNLKSGLIDVDEESIPAGLTIKVKDYDIQGLNLSEIQQDEYGPYYLHIFKRKNNDWQEKRDYI